VQREAEAEVVCAIRPSHVSPGAAAAPCVNRLSHAPVLALRNLVRPRWPEIGRITAIGSSLVLLGFRLLYRSSRAVGGGEVVVWRVASLGLASFCVASV
jgi:hypothetical protein